MKSALPTPWLGSSKGYLSDWVTQRWVRFTGRRIHLSEFAWLDGPIAKMDGIGENYFSALADEFSLDVRAGRHGSGLIQNFDLLEGPHFQVDKVHTEVRAFYEHTSNYDLDVWAEWTGVFRPLGRLLAFIFSRRLQQLNLPLSSLDTSRGMTSEIIELVDSPSGEVRYTGWLRKLVGTGNILYAGIYSVCNVPGYGGTCVKVVFPLPNGNATVIMKPDENSDDSVSLISSGDQFGDPGFYFLVANRDGTAVARYVRGMRESIRVYAAESSSVRADHILKLFGITFLRLHYRMRKRHLYEY